MNRINILFYFLLSIVISANAQNCSEYDYLTEGTYWEMTNYDKKGKVESSGAYRVKSKESIPNGMKWLFDVTTKDKKEKEVNNYSFDAKCQNGVISFDMSGVLDAATMQSFKDMDVQLSAESLEYPAKLSPGMILKNGSINIKAFMGEMAILNMTVEVRDRMVESYEDITVPAGTFKAYKITQTTNTKTKILNKDIKSIDYYVPGFGVVKTITLDKKGEVASYSELTAYKKG